MTISRVFIDEYAFNNRIGAQIPIASIMGDVAREARSGGDASRRQHDSLSGGARR
ncbi:MAG: hypothetical protein WBN96_11380 [Gammaproteobacteria bacterium]